MNSDPLIATLIDLRRAIDRPHFKLILGGGFGLYLKQLHMQRQADLLTLVNGSLWPFPRATEDLDLFLPTEIVTSLQEMQILRQALDRVGFRPVPAARFLHFMKPWGNTGRVKIDMLTGPIVDAATKARLHFTHPRIRPRGKLELHA